MNNLTPDERQQAAALAMGIAAMLRPIVKAPLRQEAIRRAVWLSGDEAILAPEPRLAENGDREAERVGLMERLPLERP